MKLEVFLSAGFRFRCGERERPYGLSKEPAYRWRLPPLESPPCAGGSMTTHDEREQKDDGTL